MKKAKRSLSLLEAATDPKVKGALALALQEQEITAEASPVPFSLGGQGIIFRIDRSEKPPTCLKIPLYPARDPSEHWLLEHDVGKEARILSILDSPAVPALLGHHANGKYIYREFIDGLILKDFARPEKGEGAYDRKALFLQLLRTAQLLFAAVHHSANGCYVIRDFKPSNLVIPFSCTDHLYLVDVGSLRPEHDMIASTLRPHRLGSRKWLYWPPEQLMEIRARLDRRADYFSFGATAYFILTGESAYSNSINDPHAALSKYLEEYESACLKVASAAEQYGLNEQSTNLIISCLNPLPARRSLIE